MKLSGDIYTYDSINNVDINKNGTDHILQKFLRSQIPSRLSLSRLNLKVRAPIILLCNLYPASGKCNRTRMVITQLRWHCIEARILSKKFNGQLCLIPRIKLTITKTDLPYVLYH